MDEEASFEQEEARPPLNPHLYLTLRNDWETMSVYGRIIIINQLVEEELSRKGFSKKRAIKAVAKQTNQSAERINEYFCISKVRGELLSLLRQERMDLNTANKIQGVLKSQKNIYEKKLFKKLQESGEHITFFVFRNVLQECLSDSKKNWKNRITHCRIRPDWTSEGEVFKDYELLYIPAELLTVDEEGVFRRIRKDEAFVKLLISKELRYAKVPMAALEPIGFRIKFGNKKDE